VPADGLTAPLAPPSAARLLRMMYWSARRKPARLAHLLGLLPAFVLHWAILWLWRVRHRRAPVAIALMDRLGDIVAVEPVTREARGRFAGTPILFVTTPPYAALPTAFAGVDRVLVVRCRTEWMLLWRTGRFRAVLDLHFSDVGCVTCGFTFAKSGPAAAITGESHYRHGNQLRTRRLCAGLPSPDLPPNLLPPPGAGPALRPDPASRRAVDRLGLPAGFVVIHCAASEPSREWPDAQWRALTEVIADRLGVTIVEIGLAPRAIAADGPRRRALCGLLSLLETADLIRRARLFIGIDSGPAHLANAVRTPGIILLGSFRGQARYMPYSGPYETGELGDLLWADGQVAGLALATVRAAVERRLAPPA
jgi:heptosyltransferase-3